MPKFETGEHRNLPQGCGPEKTRRLHKPLKSRVDITYFCTACGNKKTVSVQWRSHHALPSNWKCRDIVPTNELPRRTDHIFSCSQACRKVLDIQYPPPKKPKWFASSQIKRPESKLERQDNHLRELLTVKIGTGHNSQGSHLYNSLKMFLTS